MPLPRPHLAPALVLLLAAPAAAEEFKLALEPEPGASPPSRVCLVSRAPALRAVEIPGVSPLSTGARCPADTPGACAIDRGSPPLRCPHCPSEAHPECRAGVETGRFPVADYTAVCADDDTYPEDGGTVYIAVESVEAESPPELYTIEVSGGRVRWSPTNRLSRPSYRVIGGDFEASRLTWPRERMPPEWVTVPVRRRCRCVGVRKPAGNAAVRAARVDGAPTCHGEARPDGTLRLEVPATRDGGVRVAAVETAHSEAIARWTGRWPAPDQPARLARFDFALIPACTLPGPATCPTASARFTACDRPQPADGVCRYTCRVDPAATLDLPVTLDLHLEAPEVSWQQALEAPGVQLRGELPAARRILSARVPDGAPLDVPGDTVQATVISRQGIQTNRLLLDGSRTLYLPMPDLQCDTPLAITYEGERAFGVSTVRVQRGAAVDLPDPAEAAENVRVLGSITLGVGAKFGDFGGLTLDGSTGDLFEIRGATTLRYREFGERWFIGNRIGLSLVPNWLAIIGSRTDDDAEIYVAQDQTITMGTVEVLGGYVADVLGGVSEIYAGVGVGGAYALGASAQGVDVGFIRLLVATLGLRRPLSGSLSGWSFHVEASLRRSEQHIPVAQVEANASELMGFTPEEIAQRLNGFEEGPEYTVWALTGGLGLDYMF